MDAETIRWIITGLMGLIMYFGKRSMDGVSERLKEIETEQHNFKLNYIHKDNFKEFKDELRSLLGEIKQDIKELAKNGS